MQNPIREMKYTRIAACIVGGAAVALSCRNIALHRWDALGLNMLCVSVNAIIIVGLTKMIRASRNV